MTFFLGQRFVFFQMYEPTLRVKAISVFTLDVPLRLELRRRNMEHVDFYRAVSRLQGRTIKAQVPNARERERCQK